MLDGVLGAYGKLSGFELTDRTHIRESRWRRLCRRHSYGERIPNSLIKSIYKKAVDGGGA